MSLKIILYGLLFVALAGTLFVLTRTPSHDRDWVAHLSRLPIVDLQPGSFAIDEYRDWTYGTTEAETTGWTDVSRKDIADARRVWLMVEPHPGMSFMAHTLVLFEFADGDLIGLTVEARREEGEKYSPTLGAMRTFELIYQWASPRDLLTRRAIMLDRELYLYPLALTQAETEAYLRTVLQKTIDIEKKPRFYSTVHSNCTNELAKSAGLKWQLAFFFTGRAAEALYDQGRIDDSRPFPDVKADAKIDEWVRTHAQDDHSAFNRGLIDLLTQETS